jgi:hypothetical protein
MGASHGVSGVCEIFEQWRPPRYCLREMNGVLLDLGETAANVRFGSLADICGARGHVRFAPNSDRESRLAQPVMSALPPKADVCGANRHVCFGP